MGKIEDLKGTNGAQHPRTSAQTGTQTHTHTRNDKAGRRPTTLHSAIGNEWARSKTSKGTNGAEHPATGTRARARGDKDTDSAVSAEDMT